MKRLRELDYSTVYDLAYSQGVGEGAKVRVYGTDPTAEVAIDNARYRTQASLAATDAERALAALRGSQKALRKALGLPKPTPGYTRRTVTQDELRALREAQARRNGQAH